ncbi:hypothetical protein BV25DRAFT_1918513 [Artomyces pyxidatus]|uniref:Uncharacterized protein n=1 Tax=Artomyces pyxidatus TaxID=48021 RepID=A0ACB8SSL7_9AGAM|nr:hypothetical protein BV25DRAFT_1918513 [Artomyces pyxidatus]
MLRQSQRQLVFRCSSAHYSSSTPPRLDAAVTPASTASAQPPPPARLLYRRPLASSLGGIVINNTPVSNKSETAKNPENAAPTRRRDQSASPMSGQRNADNSRDNRRAGMRPNVRRGPINLGWADSTVSTSFVSRLQEHSNAVKLAERSPQPSPTIQGSSAPVPVVVPTRAPVQEAPVKMVQRKRERRNQERERTAQTETVGKAEKKKHERKVSTQQAREPRGPAEVPDVTVSPSLQDQMAALDKTNLSALFGAQQPRAPVSTRGRVKKTKTASSLIGLRVKTVLERTAGDYTRYASKSLGTKAPTPVTYAKHALATQRGLSLVQRRRALQIIGNLAVPAKEARA